LKATAEDNRLSFSSAFGSSILCAGLDRKQDVTAGETTSFPYQNRGFPMDYEFDDDPLEDVQTDERPGETELNDDAGYICNSCGEEIVVPLDLTQGAQQQYVEDCPVCCNPNVIFVEFDVDGVPNVWSQAE
jgi:hypothetical protein